ncbi:MAG: hypothetical protein GEEBNDBF_01758 [bacterium]|nr:hypothetical protein [bacterium]
MTEQEQLPTTDPDVDVAVDIEGLRLALHQIANGLAGVHQACQLLSEQMATGAVSQETFCLAKESIEQCLATTERVQQHLHYPDEYRLKID